MNIIKKLIPYNYSERKGFAPQLVVIHIADGTAKGTYEEFLGTPKSSHYLVCKNGEVWQFEEEFKSAFSQGLVINPTSQIVKDFIKKNPGENLNEICFGIEHEAKNKDLNLLQYKISAELIKDICLRWNIPMDKEHIIPHNAIRKDKLCPKPIQVDLIINLANEIFRKEKIVIDNLKQQLNLLQRVYMFLLELWNRRKK